MEKDNIKQLFSEGSFEIIADTIPWINAWADKLVDFYAGTNLANNINNIEFIEEITIIVEDGEIGVSYQGTGDDGEYQKFVYLTATVNNDFITLSGFDYDTETGDAIEFDEEEDE